MDRLSLIFIMLALCGCASVKPPQAMNDRSLATVTDLANSGNREAIHDLCYRYIYGLNAPLNYQKALQWCVLGASLGVDSSQVLLAEMYLNGHGTAVNYQQAHYWYSAGAEQGHEHALLMLYYIYRDGLGVGVDLDKAQDYLQQAVDAGYEPAIKVQAQAATSKQ